MQGLKVAGRYAQALLELSIEKDCVDNVLEDMKALVEVANTNDDFANFLTTPLVKEDKKAKILRRLFKDAQEITVKFMDLLTRNRREMYLPLIAEQYINKLNSIRGIVPMVFTSAQALDKKVKTTILDKLNASVKGTIALTEKIDESLIGGFLVRMGDTQIDASVSHQLTNLKQRLRQ